MIPPTFKMRWDEKPKASPVWWRQAYLALRRVIYLRAMRSLWGMSEGRIHIITSTSPEKADGSQFVAADAEPEMNAVALLGRIVYFLYAKERIEVASCRTPPPDWKQANLLLLGGPDSNTITREVLAQAPPGVKVRFTHHGEVVQCHDGTTYDPRECKDNDDIEVVIRTRNPFAPQHRTCLILAGGRAKGTEAATALVTDGFFARYVCKHARNEPFELVLNGSFEAGQGQGRPMIKKTTLLYFLAPGFKLGPLKRGETGSSAPDTKHRGVAVSRELAAPEATVPEVSGARLPLRQNAPQALAAHALTEPVALDVRDDKTLVAEPPTAAATDGGNRTGLVCGETRYSLRRPLSLGTFADLARNLGLPAPVTMADGERILHVQFQQLYRKLPAEWTPQEEAHWEVLGTYVDLEAYEADNPIAENRIGVLVEVGVESVIIRWENSDEEAYDLRDVPPQLLQVPAGWVVHAQIRNDRDGCRKFVSAWAERPFKSDEQVIAEEIASPDTVSLDGIPDADWPQIWEE